MSLCPKCSAEIPEGELICPVCKTEIQLVPDYETLYLDLVEEEKLKNNEDEATKLRKAALSAEEDRVYKRNLIIKIVVIAAVIAALAAGAYYLWNYWQENSHKETVLTFEDYYQQALMAYNSQNFDNANGILNEALKLEPGNVDALILQAKIILNSGNKYEAITAFKSIIDNNPEAVEAYRELIEIYLGDNDTESINELLNSSPDSIKTALADYISGAPILSPEPGTYTEEIDVTISSTGARIYYTTDGNVPGKESRIYDGPIHIKDGVTVIKAVSETSTGILSTVTEGRYVIDRNAPDAPIVSPSSGTYYDDENLITVTVPIGCKCYYSFDSKPVIGVNEYEGPVKMPEGDHIFYAMLVNEQGIAGPVSAATYIYYSEHPKEDTAEQEEYVPWVPEYTEPPAPTDAPAPTDTPEPTKTPEPTDTPKPTDTPTPKPDTPTPKPDTPTPKPETPTPEPETPTPEPETPTPEPETPTPEPETPTPEPDTPTPEPETPTPEPETPTPEPDTPTPEPDTPTPAPPNDSSSDSSAG